MRSLSFATFAIATAALAAPLIAQDVPSARVAYRDLNLATPEGVTTFKSRVSRAINTMCGTADFGDLTQLSAVANCRKVARTGAAPQIAMVIDQAQRLVQADKSGVRIASR